MVEEKGVISSQNPKVNKTLHEDVKKGVHFYESQEISREMSGQRTMLR